MKKRCLQLTAVVVCALSFVHLSIGAKAQENNPNSSSLNSSQNKSAQLSAEELVTRGTDKASFGRFQDAIDDFNSALALPSIRDHTKAVALTNRGLVRDILGLPHEAIKDYNMALAVPRIKNITKASALNKRGAAKGKLGRLEEALQDFRAALKLPGIDNDTKANALYNCDITSSALIQQILNMPLPVKRDYF